MTLELQVSELLEFFKCSHLPPPLRVVSAPFCELAIRLVRGDLMAGQLKTQHVRALEKLLEAKDCAVRAAL